MDIDFESAVFAAIESGNIDLVKIVLQYQPILDYDLAFNIISNVNSSHILGYILETNQFDEVLSNINVLSFNRMRSRLIEMLFNDPRVRAGLMNWDPNKTHIEDEHFTNVLLNLNLLDNPEPFFRSLLKKQAEKLELHEYLVLKPEYLKIFLENPETLLYIHNVFYKHDLFVKSIKNYIADPTTENKEMILDYLSTFSMIHNIDEMIEIATDMRNSNDGEALLKRFKHSYEQYIGHLKLDDMINLRAMIGRLIEELHLSHPDYYMWIHDAIKNPNSLKRLTWSATIKKLLEHE